jgi:catechol 2,3-dioxygenase-like lactoylglutathione lyase family enzyme
MTIKDIDNIGIAVRDVNAQAEFYETKLGLEVTRYLESEPPALTVKVGERYLYVFETSSDPAGPHHVPALVDNPPGVDHISLAVEDVDVAVRELGERGLEFAGEPTTVEDWGIRMVAFTDPENNLYFLVAPA